MAFLKINISKELLKKPKNVDNHNRKFVNHYVLFFLLIIVVLGVIIEYFMNNKLITGIFDFYDFLQTLVDFSKNKCLISHGNYISCLQSQCLTMSKITSFLKRKIISIQ